MDLLSLSLSPRKEGKPRSGEQEGGCSRRRPPNELQMGYQTDRGSNRLAEGAFEFALGDLRTETGATSTRIGVPYTKVVWRTAYSGLGLWLS